MKVLANADPEAERQELLERAKGGDGEAREILIKDFTPFVVGVASRVTGRYLRPGEDEEVSIGLMAFNEAIDSYDASKGSHFLAFAEMVLRRRLVDHYRRERSKEIPWSSLGDDEEDSRDAYEVREALGAFRRAEEEEERREEILAYGRRLAEFGLSFPDLARSSPHHRDTRESLFKVAYQILANEAYREYVFSRKALPLRNLAKDTDISRKTLERHRRYILALVVLLAGDYPYLQGYIGRKGGEGQ